ncbi:TrkA family potassium uptake protein [Candidatus Dependentiae bacterium]|nr:TrkA family potassium uptake protein [Candidatus Dependentiae bacterium]
MKFCVLGLGRFGYHVATRLAENGMEVLGVDNNETIVASVRDSITQAICMQVHDEASLRSIGVDEMDAVIVAMGENFAGSILITALLKKRLNVPLVITRAVNEIHKEILLLIGADQIILPEREIGNSLADNLSLPFRVISRIAKNYSISQISAPEKFSGKTIKKIGLQENYHLNCIGIKKDGEIIPVDKDYVVQEGNLLVLAGLNKDLAVVAKL